MSDQGSSKSIADPGADPTLRSGLDAERWGRLQTLFEEAQELTVDQLESFLQDLDETDASLRDELRAMLEQDETPLTLEQWLTGSVAAGTSSYDDEATEVDPRSLAGEAPTTDAWIGRRVGAYRLDAELGAGGMGKVYTASRVDGTYQQQVAVKLMNRAMGSASAEQRFRRERQILARLEHPNIARILDGGVTEDQVPYLVMEKVEGDSVIRVADRRRLTVGERLDLFLDICRAVDAAHRQMVVHRDLKPGNVLVDTDQQVKLLDFGIAKLLSPATDDSASDAGGPEPLTDRVPLTPAYASPEQVLGQSVTMATDVFALGLLLWELLVGERAQALEDDSLSTLVQTICKERVAEPSRAIGSLASNVASQRAALRGSTPRRWRKDVQGDLDTIVSRCLRKDPARRYGTAGELERDLWRFRQGLPVEARPDSLSYRTRKFVARHKLGVAAAILVVLSLVVGLGFALSGLERAQAAERRAAAEAQAMRQTADFLVGLFEVADPKERTEDPSARQLLDRAAAEITRDLEQSPEVRARLLGTLGRVYSNLGAFDRSLGMYEQQVALLTEAGATMAGGGDRDAGLADLAWARIDLASAMQRVGAYEQSHAAIRAVLDDLEAAGRTGTWIEGQALSTYGLATWRLGDYETALEHLQRALELRSRFEDDRTPWHMMMLNNVAILAVELGRHAEARGHYRQALEISEDLWGTGDVRLAPTLNNWGLLETQDGQPESAEELLRRSLDLRLEALGDRHPDVAESMNNLALALDEMGRFAEAEDLYTRALDLRLEVLGPEHPLTLISRFNQAANLRQQGRFTEAESALTSLEPSFVAAFGSDHSNVSSLLFERGIAVWKLDRPAEALTLVRRCLAIREAAFGVEHPATKSARDLLDDVLAATGAAPAAPTESPMQ